ncbi:MAG: hypothetical protein V3U79_11975 [Dehalococcoidia bacterium]
MIQLLARYTLGSANGAQSGQPYCPDGVGGSGGDSRVHSASALGSAPTCPDSLGPRLVAYYSRSRSLYFVIP